MLTEGKVRGGKLPHVPATQPSKPPPAPNLDERLKPSHEDSAAQEPRTTAQRLRAREKALDAASKKFLGKDPHPARVLAVAIIYEEYLLHGTKPEEIS